MDVLSEFFDQIHLSGRLFFGGKVIGTLELDKPPGTAFIHILDQGGIDLIRPGCTTIPVHEPSLLLCPTTCQYKLRSRSLSGSNIICASFDFGVHMGQTFPLGITETIIFPFSEIKKGMPAISALIEEFNGDEIGRFKALNTLFEYILVLLVRMAVSKQQITKGVLYAMLDTHLGAALRAIHEHPEENWKLEQLADIVYMSRTKFATYFLKTVGISPIGYLTAWRIKVAKDMLLEGIQLKVIASSTGYSSQAAFTRAFAREIGIPPAEWAGLNK
ncbi:AraC family transcriptional regulator [Methylotenera sp.]|uniref:helix-turn-helix transcriptional regulator n=1 Tax=Methylotenera sp. TaxID=2051956 RepID=UPI002489A8ED|nr:AraC family transcriptional regulator [Methylotenera sp.]MDI1360534.1 AraC family transcriptional regulator [Methylotenera sp.]